MPIVPKSYTHAPDTLIESTKVNANDDGIYTLINGGLDNLNIIAGAEISQSKIAGLTTALSAKKASADLYRFVARTDVLIENNVNETTLTTVALPAGTMNATDCINGRHTALITSILQGSTFYLRFYWGPTGGEVGDFDLIHQADFLNGSDSVLTNVGLFTDFHIFNRGSAQSQGYGFVTARNDSVSGSSSRSAVGGASQNTNLGCSLLVNGVWDTADADNICLGMGVELFRQR